MTRIFKSLPFLSLALLLSCVMSITNNAQAGDTVGLSESEEIPVEQCTKSFFTQSSRTLRSLVKSCSTAEKNRQISDKSRRKLITNADNAIKKAKTAKSKQKAQTKKNDSIKKFDIKHAQLIKAATETCSISKEADDEFKVRKLRCEKEAEMRPEFVFGVASDSDVALSRGSKTEVSVLVGGELRGIIQVKGKFDKIKLYRELVRFNEVESDSCRAPSESQRTVDLDLPVFNGDIGKFPVRIKGSCIAGEYAIYAEVYNGVAKSLAALSVNAVATNRPVVSAWADTLVENEEVDTFSGAPLEVVPDKSLHIQFQAVRSSTVKYKFVQVEGNAQCGADVPVSVPVPQYGSTYAADIPEQGGIEKKPFTSTSGQFKASSGGESYGDINSFLVWTPPSCLAGNVYKIQFEAQRDKAESQLKEITIKLKK
jgi:hypothetical protein